MALIIISVLFFAESVAFVILLFKVRKAKKSDTRNKEMRKEFNSAMINLRRLENLLKETARDKE